MIKIKHKGFTAIELIAVVIILGIIAGTGIYALRQFYQVWYLSGYRMEIIWSERTVMHELTRSIRTIRDENSIYLATPTVFEFTTYYYDPDPTLLPQERVKTERIKYEFKDNGLYKNDELFMDNISTGFFCYYKEYDNNGNPVLAATVSEIRFIKICITLSSNGESIPSQSTVFLRNLNE